MRPSLHAPIVPRAPFDELEWGAESPRCGQLPDGTSRRRRASQRFSYVSVRTDTGTDLATDTKAQWPLH
jgi:hypothetical protein